MKYSKDFLQQLVCCILIFVSAGTFAWDDYLVTKDGNRRTSSEMCNDPGLGEFVFSMTTNEKPTKTTVTVFFSRNGVFNYERPPISETYTTAVTNDKTTKCLVNRFCFMLVVHDEGGDGSGSYQAIWDGEIYCQQIVLLTLIVFDLRLQRLTLNDCNNFQRHLN